jgi:peptide/nickel transport system permease protein
MPRLPHLTRAPARRCAEVRRLAWCVLVAVVCAAIFAPLIAPYDPAAQLDIVALKNSVPSLAHPLGTDAYSRDVMSRLVFGARTSIVIGAVATVVALVVGCLWGGIAALANGRAGEGLMLVVDVLRTVPRMLLFLVAVALFGALAPVPLALVLGGAGWPVVARLTYALVRETRGRDFIEAAEAIGAARGRILLRHIAPHISGAIVAAGTLLLADVLAAEAGLSFLGIGVRPPTASWGNMVQDALPSLASAWWLALIPSACLLATVLAVSALARGLGQTASAALPRRAVAGSRVQQLLFRRRPTDLHGAWCPLPPGTTARARHEFADPAR